VAQLFSLGIQAHHKTNMKTKQLANVLIKILGLSVLVHAFPTIVSGFLPVIHVSSLSQGGYFWLYPLSSVIVVVIGLYLIVKSRDVAAFLFKDEDE
jgi:hypothetical protein